jgi:hypothetical protein
VTLGLLACDPAVPTFEPGVEPAEALRPADRRGEVPDAARIADYELEATLDADQHRITGKAILTWRNRTTRTVEDAAFHLYMNAFRTDDTRWMEEARGAHRGEEMNRDAWGYIDIASVRWLGQTPLEAADAAPVAAEGENTELAWAEGEDPSTMRVTLPEPVGPGQAMTLAIEFTTQLPEVFARTGYHDEFHMVAQWFPKIGVLEEEAGWKAHEFTLNSEFYADFGNYSVTIDVPEDMVVGASGIRTAEEASDGRKRLSYRAEMVHDFAWVADANFVEQWDEYEGIRIRQLIQPELAYTADLHMAAQKYTLASMEKRFGPYPWSTITIVHPPKGAEGAGGMEYPTLYTSSDALGPSPVPWLVEERASGVFTTVHEFGHQYFQGLFASNEFAQPWLDEGMNTTSNALALMDGLEARPGDDPNDPWLVRLAGHRLTIGDMFRLSVSDSLRDRVDQGAADYRDLVGSYGAMVYQKTGALMHTLRNLAGHEAWDAALAHYAEKARFRHPTGRWLEESLVEVLGERVAVVGDGGAGTVWLDVQDYLDQALRGVSEVDFELLKLENRPQVTGAGWHRGPDGALTLTEVGDDEAPIEGVVVVRRRGEFRLPVELMVEFEDGTRETVVWDGQARTRVFTWPDRRIRYALLDPTRKLWLESRRLNNSRSAKASEHVDPPAAGLDDLVGDAAQAAALAAMGAMAL